MSSIILKGIEMYHPANKVENDFYIEHFKKKGKDITRLLEAYGRKERYVAGENETTVTIAVEAGKKVLKACNLTGADIDVFIIATVSPEYIWPTNSMAAFNELGISESAQLFDVSQGCVGQLVAADAAINILKSKKNFKRALVIGAEEVNSKANKDNEYLYGLLGDSGCAIILEKVDEDNVGFLDSEYLGCGTEALTYVKYPDIGLKEVAKRPGRKIINDWKPFVPDFIPDSVYRAHERINERNNITINDINHFCYSQYAIGMTKGIAEKLNVSMDKFIYVGDKYGYTLSNSPFVALHDGIKSGRVKKGDLISLWTVGIFYATALLLLKY